MVNAVPKNVSYLRGIEIQRREKHVPLGALLYESSISKMDYDAFILGDLVPSGVLVRRIEAALFELEAAMGFKNDFVTRLPDQRGLRDT